MATIVTPAARALHAPESVDQTQAGQVTDLESARTTILDQWRSLFVNNPVPMWIYDPNSLRFIDVNRAAIAHYGWTISEFQRMTVVDIRPEEDRVAFAAALTRARAATPLGSHAMGTWRHVRKAGDVIEVEVVISDLMYEGRPARLAQMNDITERKAAEAALRNSNERFFALTELLADWYWEQDAELRFVEVSSGYYERSGFRPEQVLGHTREQVVGGQDPFRMAEYLGCVARREPFRDLLIQHRDPAGAEHIFSISGKPIFDDAGGFKGYRGIGRDITAQERMREALAASERRTKLAMEYGNVGIWEREIASGRLIWSDNIGPMMGRKPVSETTVQEFLEMVHPDDRALVETMAAERAAGRGMGQHIEHRVIGSDGNLRWISHCSNAILDSKSTPVSTIGVVLDITERKKTEAALRESEEMFRELTENIPELFWISDPGITRVLYVSPAFERLWGKPRESLYQDAAAWRDGVHPADFAAIEAFIARQGEGVAAQVEFRLQRPGRDLKWLWAESSPYVSSSGEALVSGILTDITDRKLEENARLLQAHEQRDVLVGEVHHRIKNSLQGLVGLLRKHIARHPQSADLMQGVIAQVQSVATAHGLQGLRVTDGVALFEILQAISRMVEGVVGTPIELQEVDADDRAMRLAEGENVAMALVLNELIMNAAKHGRGADPRVRVALSRYGGGVRLEIANPGGLPTGFAFSDAGSTNTGLGLVRALLPSHGASLRLETLGGFVRTSLFIQPPVLKCDPGAQGQPR